MPIIHRPAYDPSDYCPACNALKCVCAYDKSEEERALEGVIERIREDIQTALKNGEDTELLDEALEEATSELETMRANEPDDVDYDDLMDALDMRNCFAY